MFKKEGYIDSSMHVVSLKNDEGESDVVSQNVVLSPVLGDDEYRIVLTWGKCPGDLDSYLEGYKDNKCKFRLNFLQRKHYENGELVACLDRDDTISYGPETITMTLCVDNSVTYKYYVRDYTNQGSGVSMALSFSCARVEVYSSERKIEEFTIAPNQYGTRWDVFNIENGKIKRVDEVK